MIETSTDVDQLFPALLNAFKKIGNPKMSGNGIYGPYATLQDIEKVSKQALLDEGLIPMQSAYVGGGGLVIVDTHIYHTTGQYIACKGWANQPDGKNPLFAGGAALTYARRQALASMLQLVGELDPEEERSIDRDDLIKQIEEHIDRNKNPERQKMRLLDTYKVNDLKDMSDDDLGRALDACESAK